MYKKINIEKCSSWWTIPTDCPCDLCGKQSDVVMQLRTFWFRRLTTLCHECRRKWLAGELNI